MDMEARLKLIEAQLDILVKHCEKQTELYRDYANSVSDQIHRDDIVVVAAGYEFIGRALKSIIETKCK